MKYTSFYSKAQGASHIKSNLVCQDSVSALSTDDYTIAAVADGHGSSKYFRSDRGSSFATDVAISTIGEFLDDLRNDNKNFDSVINEGKAESYLLQLEKSILSRWHAKVEEDYNSDPFSQTELEGLEDKYAERYRNKIRIETAYGCTLLAVVIAEQYWFGIHIGDGKCIFLDYEKKFSEPIPWDDKCFLNVTTSMCDMDAIHNFRHAFGTNPPVAAYIASDGIDDCFSNADDNIQLYGFYQNITKMFAQNDFEYSCKQLEEYLPILSEKGSKDDMSIAVTLDLGSLSTMYGVETVINDSDISENAELTDGSITDE